MLFPLLLPGPALGCAQTPATAAAAAPARSTIRVHYDTGFGHFLAIRGDAAPLSWSTGQPARWTAGNVWLWQGPAAIGRFEFKPLYDDRDWSTGGNYVYPAGAGAVDVYPFFGPSQGTLTVVADFWSPQLRNTRALRIYLPPSYGENPYKRYPVLYMHDGQNLFDPRTAAFGVEWEVDETMNHEIGNGRVREAIVVGVDNTPGRLGEYTPTRDPHYGGGDGEAYLDFLQHTVKPYVDAHYRTLPGAADTRMLGSSLGGLISFHAGWTRPQVWSGVGCMSSSFWWDDEAEIALVESHTGPDPACVFYLDSGGPADGAAETFRMRDALFAQGYRYGVDLYHWYEPSGQHNEAFWAARLHRPLQILLPWE